MKRTLLLLSCLLVVQTHVNSAELAKDGATSWKIVLPDAPTLVEKTAARELAEHGLQVGQHVAQRFCQAVRRIDHHHRAADEAETAFARLGHRQSCMQHTLGCRRGRIEQPPRVEIVQPTDITELVDPIDVEIKVNTSFTRWDGVPYTTTGTFAESEAAMDYVLMTWGWRMDARYVRR
jgi:hypothetical protein